MTPDALNDSPAGSGPDDGRTDQTSGAAPDAVSCTEYGLFGEPSGSRNGLVISFTVPTPSSSVCTLKWPSASVTLKPITKRPPVSAVPVSDAVLLSYVRPGGNAP